MTAREWYVVIGLAKTGTTVVATAVLRARGIARFCLEPESAAEIEALAASDRLVIKIIFDIWMQRSDALTRLCGGPHVTTIATVRDPRDELVSRLHYLAYDYFSKRETTPDDREDWIDIFRRKEEAPERIGLLDMREQILARFGRGFGPLPELHESYADFLDELAGAVHLLRYEDFVRGNVLFHNGLELKVFEYLDLTDGEILDYSYTVLRGVEKIRWYDPQPHPDNPELASTFPHHRHEPPDTTVPATERSGIKHNRKPAPGISFQAPNLPALIADCIELGKAW